MHLSVGVRQSCLPVVRLRVGCGPAQTFDMKTHLSFSDAETCFLAFGQRPVSFISVRRIILITARIVLADKFNNFETAQAAVRTTAEEHFAPFQFEIAH